MYVRSATICIRHLKRHTNLLCVGSSLQRYEHQQAVSSNDNRRVQTLDDYLEARLDASSSKLPRTIDVMLTKLRNRLSPAPIDANLKILLDQAATQLYFNCANNYNYEKLCDSFGLPDYFSTWFKLTLLHIWMVLLRTHVSMDATAFMRLQSGLLASLWHDVDKRLSIVSEELGKTMTASSDVSTMHGLHIQTFLEYDEGFLTSDAQLAAAIWRCLYLSRDVDPIDLLKVVLYLRSTVSWLDTLDIQEILVDGITQWKQLELKS